MDMLDFESDELYFEEAMKPETEKYLQVAAEAYADGEANEPLMKAYALEPEHPMVLVAMYRYYYYQHQYINALQIADRVFDLFAKRLSLPADWHQLNLAIVQEQEKKDISALRFYLWALKGAAYLEMRLGDLEPAREKLHKLIELDSQDRLGATALLEVLNQKLMEKD